MSTLLLPAVAVLVLPGADDGGSAGGARDATSLALTAQTSLLEQAGRYRQLEQAVARGDVAQCTPAVRLVRREDVRHGAIVIDHPHVGVEPGQACFRPAGKFRRPGEPPRPADRIN